MPSEDTTTLHGRPIKQKRGHLTYQALIEAAFLLLETKELDNISVAEVASEAGYSVGAFYSRFHSKDELFDAIVKYHLERRTQSLNRIYEHSPIDRLVEDLVRNIVEYYWQHRRFWRAVQLRNVRDPEFAKRFRQNFKRRSQKFIDRMEGEIGRKLSKDEKTGIYFAFQLLLGTVNNAAFNESGPILLGQKLFQREMVRTFRLVSGIDTLIGKSK